MNDDFYSRFFREDRDIYGGDGDFSFGDGVVKGAKRTFSRLFLGLSLYLIICTVLINATAIVTYFLGDEVYIAVFGTSLGQNILDATVQYLIALPAFWLFVRKMEVTAPTYRVKITPKEFFVFFLIAQLLMTIGSYIGVFINSALSVGFGSQSTNHTAESIAETPILLTLIFSVILTPIAEELLMRKLFIDRLKKYGEGFAVIVSALSFGLFHGNLYQFFYAALTGLVLGFIYIRGGLKYSVLLHMLLNFWGSIMVLLYNKAAETVLGPYEPGVWFYLALAFVIFDAIISIVFLILGIKYLVRCIRILRDGFNPYEGAVAVLPKGTTASVVFKNAGVITFLVITGFYMLVSFIA